MDARFFSESLVVHILIGCSENNFVVVGESIHLGVGVTKLEEVVRVELNPY